MAFRDLSKDFADIRLRYLKPSFGEYTDDDDRYARVDEPRHEDIELGDADQFGKQPSWVLILKNVQDNISNIKNGMENLKRLQNIHATFSLKKNFQQEEQNVRAQTEEVKRLFVDSKKAIARIDISKKPKNEEQLMKQHLKISLITELNELSTQFKDEQTEYMKNLNRMKANRRENMTKYDDYDADLDPEERERIAELEQKLQNDPGFTDDQVRQMLLNEQDIIRRDKEMREILTSIVELNELFKEFSQLVIEQGTLLDRIDYNLENAHDSIQRANADLLTAEKYQKMSRMTLVILVLILLVVGVALFFALKLVLKFSGAGIFL